MSRNRIALFAIAVMVAGSVLTQAQTQNSQASDIEALKDKLQQLEQSMQEVKAEINALETKSALGNEVASLKATAPPSEPSPRVLPHSSSFSTSVPAAGIEATEFHHTGKSQQQEPQAEDQKLPSEHELKPAPAGTFQLYGHVMLDSGYNFGQIDPNWFDVMRPTKLPALKNEFGPDGSVFFSVRQFPIPRSE
jgi:hypothetical protein